MCTSKERRRIFTLVYRHNNKKAPNFKVSRFICSKKSFAVEPKTYDHRKCSNRTNEFSFNWIGLKRLCYTVEMKPERTEQQQCTQRRKMIELDEREWWQNPLNAYEIPLRTLASKRSISIAMHIIYKIWHVVRHKRSYKTEPFNCRINSGTKNSFLRKIWCDLIGMAWSIGSQVEKIQMKVNGHGIRSREGKVKNINQICETII